MARAWYWRSREIRQQQALLSKTIQDTEDKLGRQYRMSSRRISQKMSALYTKILNDPNPTVDKLYQYNRYYEMLNEINVELQKLGQQQVVSITNNMTSLYNQNYAQVGKGMPLNSMFDTRGAEKAISKIWCGDGLNWSSRIWNDKTLLADMLTRDITDAISTGASVENFEKQLINTFNSSYYQARRIVRTELNYVMTQSTLDRYENDGIKEYEILAELDASTCEECDDLDGERFPIGQEVIGKNCPPFHPNCRCTIMAVIPETMAVAQQQEQQQEPQQQEPQQQEQAQEPIKQDLSQFSIDELKARRDWLENDGSFEALISGDKELMAKYKEESEQIREYLEHLREEEEKQKKLEEAQNVKGQANIAKETIIQNKLTNGDQREFAEESTGVSFRGSTQEVAKAYNEVITEVAGKYNLNDVKGIYVDDKKVQSLGQNVGGFNSTALSIQAKNTDYEYFLKTNTIYLKKETEQSIAKVIDSLTNGWHASVPPTRENACKYTLVHELGHTFLDPRNNKVVEHLYNSYIHDVEKNVVAPISQYSLTNSHEFMAEAFANNMLGGKPNIYADKVMDIIEQYFGNGVQVDATKKGGGW